VTAIPSQCVAVRKSDDHWPNDATIVQDTRRTGARRLCQHDRNVHTDGTPVIAWEMAAMAGVSQLT
jgi:hypothetical protein